MPDTLILLGLLVEGVAFSVLFTAWLVCLGRSADSMIRAFNWQTVLLAFYVPMAFFQGPQTQRGSSGLGIIAALPMILILLILLGARVWLLKGILQKPTTPEERLDYGKSGMSIPRLVALTGLLTSLAFAFTYRFAPAAILRDPLAVGLCLILLGLSVMMTRRDLLSQAVGFIVVENGLYLAGIALVAPARREIVVIFCTWGAIFFVLLSLIVLRVLLSLVHEKAKSFDMDNLQDLKG